MTEAKPIVFVVDDDASVRDGLERLLRSVGLETLCFASADDFLRAPRPDRPSCLLLDVRMGGKSGLELHEDLLRRDDPVPIIFLTGHGDVPMAVRTLKRGAHDFLLKPFREQELLDSLHRAIEIDRERRETSNSQDGLLSRFNDLSTRERDVVTLAVDGLLNKEIAQRLHIQEVTVKVNRAKAMRKLKALNFADLCAKILQVRGVWRDPAS